MTLIYIVPLRLRGEILAIGFSSHAEMRTLLRFQPTTEIVPVRFVSRRRTFLIAGYVFENFLCAEILVAPIPKKKTTLRIRIVAFLFVRELNKLFDFQHISKISYNSENSRKNSIFSSKAEWSISL